MARFAYDTSHTPAVPVIAITVGMPGSAPRASVTAIPDTGADRTLLPEAVALALLQPTGSVRLVGVGGTPWDATTYDAEIGIDGISRVVQVAAWADEAILGRDFMNHAVVTFDGPNLVLRVDA